MSEKLCALKKVGGDNGSLNIPTYMLGTGVTSAFSTSTRPYTYTATAECLMIMQVTIDYSSSGYRRITLNGTDVVYDTTKGTFCDMLHLQSGDVLSYARESRSNTLDIGIIDWNDLSS